VLGIPCFLIVENTFDDVYAIPRTIRALVAATPVGVAARVAAAARVTLVDTILKTDLACSLAKADITKGAPHAIGTAGVAGISVDAGTLLSSLEKNLPAPLQLGNTVDQVNTLLKAAKP